MSSLLIPIYVWGQLVDLLRGGDSLVEGWYALGPNWDVLLKEEDNDWSYELYKAKDTLHPTVEGNISDTWLNGREF